MKKEIKNTLTRINIILIAIILLLIVIIFFIYIRGGNINSSIVTRDSNSDFFFTNPILDCENVSQGEPGLVSSEDLNKKILSLKDKYSIGHISLYYRDLNNGPWIGVNEKEEFSPASLLKVPIMMAFLHEAEYNPSLLDKKIVVSDSDFNKDLTPNISFPNLLSVGNEYSLLQVAESMIEKSDNTGVIILLKNIHENFLKGVFSSVGVPYKNTNTEVSVRVKDYAGFFRVLFNSSYLNREMSEKALEILSKSEYKNGLSKGVPKEVVIAHKFGERTTDLKEGNIQLHDCGIIYYPQKPYILCVMTRGNSFKDQESTIGEISKYVYDQVDKNSK